MEEKTKIPSDGEYGMSDVGEPKKFKPYKVEKDDDTNNGVKID